MGITLKEDLRIADSWRYTLQPAYSSRRAVLKTYTAATLTLPEEGSKVAAETAIGRAAAGGYEWLEKAQSRRPERFGN